MRLTAYRRAWRDDSRAPRSKVSYAITTPDQTSTHEITTTHLRSSLRTHSGHDRPGPSGRRGGRQVSRQSHRHLESDVPQPDQWTHSETQARGKQTHGYDEPPSRLQARAVGPRRWEAQRG